MCMNSRVCELSEPHYYLQNLSFCLSSLNRPFNIFFVIPAWQIHPKMKSRSRKTANKSGKRQLAKPGLTNKSLVQELSLRQGVGWGRAANWRRRKQSCKTPKHKHAPCKHPFLDGYRTLRLSKLLVGWGRLLQVLFAADYRTVISPSFGGIRRFVWSCSVMKHHPKSHQIMKLRRMHHFNIN